MLVPFPRGTRAAIWWRKFQYSITFGLLCIALHQIYMKESRTQRRKMLKKSVKLGKERSMSKFKDADNDQYRKRLVQLKRNFPLYTGMLEKVPGGQDSIPLVYTNTNYLERRKYTTPEKAELQDSLA